MGWQQRIRQALTQRRAADGWRQRRVIDQQSTRTLHSGYGTYKGPGDTKYISTHRYAWQLDGRPPLSAHQQLVTDCGTQGCVRPDHQKVVLRGSHWGAARYRP